MRLGKWRLLVGILITALYVAVFVVTETDIVPIRKWALGIQFTTLITHIGSWKLILAGVFLAAAVMFGRVYCSLLCPAGHLQDIFSRLGRWLGVQRTGYRKNKQPLLFIVLATVCSILGIFWLATYLDPLGLFGRFIVPVSERLRDLLGEPYKYEMEMTLVLTMSIMLLVIIPPFIGRWFCEVFCPVGVLLGVFSSLGDRRIGMDKRKCVSCGQCEKACPVHCIDAKAKNVESDRCVLCLDCLPSCKFNALSYGKHIPENRRDFMERFLTAMTVGMFAVSRDIGRRWGLGSRIENEIKDVSPPGSGGNINHRQRCVSCQSCVPTCPVGIIRSKTPHLRPVLDYDRGYCQYSCNECSRSCPAGALGRISLETKQKTRIAKTTFVSERCVVVRNGTACGACAEVCPTHALVMKEQGDGKSSVPDFKGEYCIGCGGCYHVCPAEPRAFEIVGLEQHEIAAGIRLDGHGAGADKGKEKIPEGGAQEFPF